jgi:tetratricopeptide (TPR) repeat protein
MENAEGFLEKSNYKFRSGDISGAITEYTGALELNSNYLQAYHNRGLSKLEQRNFRSAIENFTISIRLNPSTSRSYCCRSQARYELGDFNGSIEDLNNYMIKRKNCTVYFYSLPYQYSL